MAGAGSAIGVGVIAWTTGDWVITGTWAGVGAAATGAGGETAGTSAVVSWARAPVEPSASAAAIAALAQNELGGFFCIANPT